MKKNNNNTATVVAVLSTWCACGCCVPYGEGAGVLPEAYADMASLRLDNGAVVETSYYSVGTLLQQDEEGFWFPVN